MDSRPDEADQESLSPYHYGLNNPILKSDPNGDCVNCLTAAIGAGVGALIGGGIEAGMQLYEHGEVRDWGAVGGAATQGFVTGGVAGFTGGASLLVTTGASAGANVVGGAINNAIQGKENTAGTVVRDAAIGVAAGVGGKLIEKAVSAVRLSNLGKQVVEKGAELIGAKQAPATIVGAQAKGVQVIATSGKIPEKVAPQLAKAAEKVGGVGAKNAGNTVGCCGEFQAANKLLLNMPKLSPKDIQFTPAIRPRTGEIIPPCPNCQQMFGIK